MVPALVRAAPGETADQDTCCWEDAGRPQGSPGAAQQEGCCQPTSTAWGRERGAVDCKVPLWPSAPGQKCQPWVSNASVLTGSAARVPNQEADVQIRE